ncbi:head-tail adaptor protein [Martelella lutilitoris]|uniref:Head-tail adaptor protein n=1 Tax=Martelella lutilitoris TaxID=2583532 RepID=A0A5C4JNC9_9HYPH|nr:head-tail adaptor protein [Martelella lutilitoris]TNB46810.1 head-tail adaptor protein [Martelella lutilitoris]
MARPATSGGQLRSRLHFQKRIVADDGYGNEVAGPFETVFTRRAQMIARNGTETVMAARLQGVQPYTVRIRYSAEAAAVTADWRIMDARKPGRVFAITAPPVNVDDENRWIEMMVSEGEPS